MTSLTDSSSSTDSIDEDDIVLETVLPMTSFTDPNNSETKVEYAMNYFFNFHVRPFK